MEIFKLFGSILVDSADAENSIARTEGQASSMAGELGSGIKTAALWGAGIAAAAGAAAVGIGALARPLIESAAAAQATEAQFGEVFKKMESEATSAMNKIAEDTGMLPNRLKGSFIQMAAFAKTTGMETADALSLSERATRAAADGAAFYDKSIEDVSDSLQSFLKGNFANDAALGISATETTRNAAANKLYSKSFKDLDESQKQLTLLQMVEDGNKLSGALGQAAKESDAFENQLGNLKQSWEDIKAKFGEPILEPAVAMIGGLAKIISNFDVEPIIQKFETFGKFIYTHVVSKVQEMQPQISSAIENVKGVFGTFVEFAIGAFAKFNEVKPIVLNVIDNIRGVFDGFVTFAKGIFTGDGNIGESFVRVFNVVKTVAMPILEDAIAFVKTKLGDLKKFWDENGEQIGAAVKNVFSAIAKVIEVLMPVITFIVEDAWNAIKNVISGALDIIMGVVKVFSGLFTGDFDKMWEGIKQVFGGAVEAIWGLLQLGFLGKIFKIIKGFGGSAVDVITGMGARMKGKFDEIVTSATERFNKVKEAIMKPIDIAKDKVKEAVEFIKGLFDKLKLKLPTIKTPSFKLKNWSANPKDWLDNMPSIGISWNALGGVFTKPTVLPGANGTLQGFGEAGAEAILPLNRSTFEGIARPIGEIVSKSLEGMLNGAKNGASIVNNFYSNNLDAHEVARIQKKELEKLGYGW